MSKALRSARLLRLSSKDRQNPNDNNKYKCIFNLNDSHLQMIQRVTLKSCYFVNSSYNINQYNNELLFDLGSGVVGFKMTEGQYDVDDFKTQLISEFATFGLVLTIALNNQTKKFELSFSNPVELKGLKFGSTLAPVIGFEQDRATDINHIMPFMPDLSGLRKIFIGSNKLSNTSNLISTDNSSKYNIFGELDVREPFGFVVHRVIDQISTQDQASYAKNKNLSTIDIELFDQDLNPLDLNGQDWEIVLKLYGDI